MRDDSLVVDLVDRFGAGEENSSSDKTSISSARPDFCGMMALDSDLILMFVENGCNGPEEFYAAMLRSRSFSHSRLIFNRRWIRHLQ